MANLSQRVARLERVRKTNAQAQFQTIRNDGLVMICRAGKAIIALPDNGRDCHA